MTAPACARSTPPAARAFPLRLRALFLGWLADRRGRADLARLDDHLLRDVGLQDRLVRPPTPTGWQAHDHWRQPW